MVDYSKDFPMITSALEDSVLTQHLENQLIIFQNSFTIFPNQYINVFVKLSSFMNHGKVNLL